MFTYYSQLALRSFKRYKGLTVLMVLAIALGIGASMTTLTVFYVLSGDPIPHKSKNLFYVQLDAESKNGYTPGEEPNVQLTRLDAETLLREKKGLRQALMTGGEVVVLGPKVGAEPFQLDARYTSADMFKMFDMPFADGSGWTIDDDEKRARVAVISKELSEKLFGDEKAIGKTVQFDSKDFRIVGILNEWRPTPKFYDLNTGKFNKEEEIYIPFSTSRDLDMGQNGRMDCWGETPDGQTAVNAPCAWLQYWVELDNPNQSKEFENYLTNYSEIQRSSGRFERPANIRFRNIMEWLDFNKVVPSDVKMQMWLAIGFLFVCLVNTIGLMLAKCLRRSSEIGVRRALGATKQDIFKQFLIESGMIGLSGGILGLGLAYLGLWGIRQNPAEYAQLAQLNASMLLFTFVLAIISSLLAGLLPAWRACQIAPAIQLKSQ